MTLSKSRDALVAQTPLSIFTVILAGVLLHITFLSFNWYACRVVSHFFLSSAVVSLFFWRRRIAIGPWALHLSERERRAVLLMTSQKTLPVAVSARTQKKNVSCLCFKKGRVVVSRSRR